MTKIINKLNLNRSPQLVENNSLIFAKNIKLDETTGNIVNDDDFKVSKVVDYITSMENYKDHKIVGSITTPNELILFVYIEQNDNGNIRIIRYNEYYDDINEYYLGSSFKYNEGEYNGTYIYNSHGELIIVFCESLGTGKNPMRTVNLGNFDTNNKINDLTSKSYNDSSYFNLVPDIPIAKCKLNGYVPGIRIPNGVYQFFIRYKIDNTTYSKWFPIGAPYYGLHVEHKNLIEFNLYKEVCDRFDCYVNNPNLDSSYGFSLSISLSDIPKYVNHYQIGYLLCHEGAVLARIYNEFPISNNNFVFDANYLQKSTIEEFTQKSFNLYNVENIVNYNNRVYISNYNENNNNLSENDFGDTIKNIKVNYILKNNNSENVNEKIYKYKITLYITGLYNKGAYPVYISTNEKIGNSYKLRFTKDICDQLNLIYDSDVYVGGFNNVNYTKVGNLNENYCLILDDKTPIFAKVDFDAGYDPVAGTIILSHYMTGSKVSAKVTDYEIEQINNSIDSYSYNYLSDRTLMPNEVYSFFIHFVRNDGSYTNGIKLHNNATPLDNKTNYDVYEFELVNNALNGNFGYYKNSNNEVLFKTPIVNNELIIPVFSNISVPEGYIGYFISYEKPEKTVVYQGRYEDFLRSIECETYIESYKGLFIRRVDQTKYYKIIDQKIIASNTFPEAIGKNGGIEIKVVNENGESINLDENQIYEVSVSNTNIYTKSNKTLIRLTDIFTKEEHSTSETNSDFTLPSYYCIEYYIYYLFRIAFIDSDTVKKLYTVDPKTHVIKKLEESHKLISDRQSYYKYSNYNLNCISIRHKSKLFIDGIDDEAKIQYFVDPATISDTFELKSDYILLKTDATGLLDIISSQAYDPESIVVSRFDNTVRRSDVFSNESIENTWRNFVGTNYKIITNNRGKITKLIPNGKSFLVHLEHSLFMFDRDNKMKLQDKEIQLSTPDTFDLEAQEIFTSENGACGLQDKNSALLNSFGYYFYDGNAKALYCFDNGKLSLISSSIKRFIDTHNITKVHVGYDDSNYRTFFTFYCNDIYVTLSYNNANQSFVSLHDFCFNKCYNTRNNYYFLSKDNKSICIKSDTISDFKYSSCFEQQKDIFPAIFENNSPSAIIDVICNTNYELRKVLNSVSYILSKQISVDYNVYQAEDDILKSFCGEKMMIYSDSCATDYQLLGKANDSNLENNNKVVNNSYKYPWYDKGVWNYNYFRNILNAKSDISDERSLIYGKYFVVRFVFNGYTKFKLENLNFNISSYE